MKSIFALQTFRLTLQNLQRFLIFLIFFLSIMNLPMFLAKPKLKSSPLIILITSKSIWKKVFNLQLALYTLFQHPNKRLSRNSLRKISTWVSFDQSPLHMVHWSYLLRGKIVYYTSVLTSMVLTAFPKRIVIHFCLSSIY